MNKIVYVPPVYEEAQHEVVAFSTDEKGNKVPAKASLHSDVSLMLRIDKLRMDAEQYSRLKDALQPMIDSSNFRQEFEDTFGALTDKELIESCPSRYIQTESEKMNYLKELAAKDKEARATAEKEKADLDKRKADEEQEKQHYRFIFFN